MPASSQASSPGASGQHRTITAEGTAKPEPASNEAKNEGVARSDNPSPSLSSSAETKQSDKPADPAKSSEPEVNLSVWAKTSAKNRELAKQNEELQSKLKELESKLTATPDDDSKFTERLLAELKKPGIAKRMLTDGGRTFDDIIAELTDLPKVDPAVDELNKRLDALEQSKKYEATKLEESRSEAQRIQAEKYAEDARSEITLFAKSEQVNTFVTDEKDSRNGTKRWAIVANRPDLIELARQSVSDIIAKDHPKGIDEETASKLVSNALDELEVQARKDMEPIINELTKRPISIGETDKSRSVIETPDLVEPRSQPRTITSNLSGPGPISRDSKGRYKGGPRQIVYTD